jgi:hypothetical protein
VTSKPRPHGAGESSHHPHSRGGTPAGVASAQSDAASVLGLGRVKNGASEGPGPLGRDIGLDGPPWPVAESVTGSARGMSLRPPNRRHTINGARSGEVRERNTIYLRGHESAAASDVQGIAAGRGVWLAEQLRRNPRFTANPEAVAKAKAIYDGTYEP